MNLFEFAGILQWGKEAVYWPVLHTLKQTLLTPYFYVGVGLILVIEKGFPARSEQKVFSVSLVQDFLWLFIGRLFEVNIIAAFVVVVKSFYDQNLNFLTIHALSDLPVWARFAWGVIILDFAGWFHHWVRHKVPWFWQFHTVHHSQRALNIFTDYRYHFVEYLVVKSLLTIPFLIAAVDPPKIIIFAVFLQWYTGLYHGNIKSNFGVLRYVLVTPQSHRIHHSIELKHRDKNFGVLFSFWDRIFGTQYCNYDEYPDTGIEDEAFPNDGSFMGLGLILAPLTQMTYPFRKIAQGFKR